MSWRLLPIYLNAFEILYDSPLGYKLEMIFIPKENRVPLTRIVNILKRNNWMCTYLNNDYDEENLKAGVYIVPRGIENEIAEIRHAIESTFKLTITGIQRVSIEPNNYIMKRVLIEDIYKKLKSSHKDVWIKDSTGTLTFALKTDAYKLDIGSRLFEAYKAYELRIEKFFGRFYAIVDYRLKIFPPSLNIVLSHISERYDVLKGAYIKCELREEPHENTEVATYSSKLIRGLIKDIKKLDTSHTLEVEGDIIEHKGASVKIIKAGVSLYVDASECSLMDNPRYYKELLNLYKEDYHKIIKKIRENSTLTPDKRYMYIKEGAKILGELAFPISIGGVTYYINESPLAIGVQTYE